MIEGLIGISWRYLLFHYQSKELESIVKTKELQGKVYFETKVQRSSKQWCDGHKFSPKESITILQQSGGR